MKPSPLALIAVLLMIPPESHCLAEEPLAVLVKKSYEGVFKEPAAKAAELLFDGRLDEANATWLAARPDSELTPAECFLLGNTFFKIAPNLSEMYLKRAYEALPESPETNLEWAMTLHLKGRHKEAASCYRKCLITVTGHHLPHVLLADCLIREGDLKAAVEHWSKADHASNHTGIDFAICAIYGPLSPHLRHFEITKAVLAGDISRVEDMVHLAANWDTDWWNSEVNKKALTRSLELAEKVLANDAKRLAELELFAATFSPGSKDDTAWLREQLTALNLVVGEGSALPVSNRVAEHLCALAMEKKLATKSELLERFEGELRRRSLDAEKGDVRALNLLAALLIPDDELQSDLAKRTNEEKLAEVNRVGWERFHDARFAASYLVSAMARNELKARSPLLKRALQEFPEDRWICEFALRLAMEEGLALQPYLVSSIKAEFRHLSVTFGISRDSYRLKSLFALLEQGL